MSCSPNGSFFFDAPGFLEDFLRLPMLPQCQRKWAASREAQQISNLDLTLPT
jgi:hypothetical protein